MVIKVYIQKCSLTFPNPVPGTDCHLPKPEETDINPTCQGVRSVPPGELSVPQTSCSDASCLLLLPSHHLCYSSRPGKARMRSKTDKMLKEARCNRQYNDTTIYESHKQYLNNPLIWYRTFKGYNIFLVNKGCTTGSTSIQIFSSL